MYSRTGQMDPGLHGNRDDAACGEIAELTAQPRYDSFGRVLAQSKTLTRRHPGRYCEPGSIAHLRTLNPGKSNEGRIQVLPFGIAAFDQLDLPLPPPSLDALFLGNGVGDVIELLIPDEPRHIVFGSEAGQHLVAMLPHPASQISGHAGVERAALA